MPTQLHFDFSSYSQNRKKPKKNLPINLPRFWAVPLACSGVSLFYNFHRNFIKLHYLPMKIHIKNFQWNLYKTTYSPMKTHQSFWNPYYLFQNKLVYNQNFLHRTILPLNTRNKLKLFTYKEIYIEHSKQISIWTKL